MECPICFEEYDHDQKYKIPRLLQCGHTFCTRCIVGIVVECPSCRCAIPTSSSQREQPINYSLISMIQQQKREPSSSSSAVSRDETLASLRSERSRVKNEMLELESQVNQLEQLVNKEKTKLSYAIASIAQIDARIVDIQQGSESMYASNFERTTTSSSLLSSVFTESSSSVSISDGHAVSKDENGSDVRDKSSFLSVPPMSKQSCTPGFNAQTISPQTDPFGELNGFDPFLKPVIEKTHATSLSKDDVHSYSSQSLPVTMNLGQSNTMNANDSKIQQQQLDFSILDKNHQNQTIENKVFDPFSSFN